VSEPHGPIKISANRQIALPKALTDRLKLEPGDQVYVMADDHSLGALVVVPVERVTEWMHLGREIEERGRADRRAETSSDE
jgi:AbrB family looped-hinge helix DNA binding protein